MMTFGKDSTCSEIVLDTNNSFKRLAGCYRSQCLENGTVLKLKLSNEEEILCSRKGEIKYIGNLSIICQDPKLVCQMRDFNSQRVVSPHEPQTTPSPTTIPTPHPTKTIIPTPKQTISLTPIPTKILTPNLTPKITENNEFNNNSTVVAEKEKNGLLTSVIVLSCLMILMVIGISILVIVLCRSKKEIQPENDISEVLVPKPDGEKLEIDAGEQL
ncbi:regulation of choline O-acetyltransferase protein [Trichomonas vaginalis G3]|nr:regulation of choline O-acetyltransferase protein [Trichomonas vaginalis G3]KAI5552666.1 regulation of choline O-acetyltransferase protein [Trichomonas vaginalis G3]